MTISGTLDFLADYSDQYSSNKNWTPLPLKENEFRSVTDCYGNKNYLIVDTRESLLYSNIELIRRRRLGLAIPFCLGAITFIITSLVTQSPLVKIVTLISSIAIPFFFSFMRGLFFQKIETRSVGIQMDNNKERLLTLFGQKMIQALGGFEKVGQLRDDWDGSAKDMQTGIEYCLDQQKNVIIGFSFLRFDLQEKRYKRTIACITKNNEGWKIIESNGFIRWIEIDGNLKRLNTIGYDTPEEKELLDRITRFINRKALSSFDRISFTEKEILPAIGKTNIFMLDCPYDDLNKVNEVIDYLDSIEFA